MALSKHPRSRSRTGGGWNSNLLEDARRRPLALVLVVLPVLGIALLLQQQAIPDEIALHGMYVPIVLAAYLFGLPGSVVTGLVAGMVVASAAFRLADPAGQLIPVFYLAVALLSGRLLDSIEERRRKVVDAQISTLKSFASAVETDDERAGEHCERVAANARTLGEALGLGRSELDELYWAGLLHDIGKVTVPREILHKPGGLTLEEYLVMRRHARLGANLLSSIDSFRKVAEGVGAHHERWDGSGYPGGLHGEDIPLYGRILAVVDVFEALSSDRPYRRAFFSEEAIEELRQSSGRLFDPGLVELYESLYRQGRIRVGARPDGGDEQPQVELRVARQTLGGPN